MKTCSILALAVMALWIGSADAKYSGGTGEPNDPYRIATPENLNDIGNHEEDWDKHFILVNDVNLAGYTGAQFKIIGRYGPDYKPFTGVFDGNDHKVSNFKWFSMGGTYIGLFGCVGKGSQIKNMGMENVNVNAVNEDSVGGLVGFNYGTITNCYSTGRVSGDRWVGGLLGVNVGGTIANCHSLASVSGKGGVGGLVGWNEWGTITNCYSAGSVSGDSPVGGLVGLADPYTTVSASFWDINTSGWPTSAGGTPKTTAEMKTMSTFTNAGWDFVEIWGIGENQTYPFLLTEPAGDANHDKKADFVDLAILASHWLEER